MSVDEMSEKNAEVQLGCTSPPTMPSSTADASAVATAAPAPAFSRRAGWEIVAVIGTGILNILPREVFVPQIVFIAMVVVGWGVYVGRRIHADRTLIVKWGFRRYGLRETFIATSIVALIGLFGMAGIGWALHGGLTLHWHMLPLLFLYPIWGLIQQFLVQGLVVANLARLPKPIGSAWVITPIAAVLFGIVHVPETEIVLGTFLLGAAFTPIYLKWRNLWPLGLFHGVLGVFVYFWIVGVNPLHEIVK